MTGRVDRRAFLALSGATLLSSCSRLAATVYLTIEPSALEQVRAVVRSFASSHRYEIVPVIGGDPEGLYYEGRLSRFEFYREAAMAPGTFVATFSDKRPFPFQEDIYARLKDFVAAIRPIKGIVIPEGFE